MVFFVSFVDGFQRSFVSSLALSVHPPPVWAILRLVFHLPGTDIQRGIRTMLAAQKHSC